jgi:hypothetical protein
VAKSAFFQLLLTPHGLGEGGVHSRFVDIVTALGLPRPESFSHKYSYQSSRAKPALTVELRVSQRKTDHFSPIYAQHSVLINIDRFGKAPTSEVLRIAEMALSQFDVHMGGLQTIGLLEALSETDEGRRSGSLYGLTAPAVLPCLFWSALPRPVWCDLSPWAYISSKFYPTVHDALMRGNYPEVSPAPKGVWVKTGDWTMDGATNLARMKTFWRAFWERSGLDCARLPGAMGPESA